MVEGKPLHSSGSEDCCRLSPLPAGGRGGREARGSTAPHLFASLAQGTGGSVSRVRWRARDMHFLNRRCRELKGGSCLVSTFTHLSPTLCCLVFSFRQCAPFIDRFSVLEIFYNFFFTT